MKPAASVFTIVDSVEIASGTLTRLDLSDTTGEHVCCRDGIVRFATPGWYEVLMTVRWASTPASGTRFSHTKISGQEWPLHSEAIDGAVLVSLNGGMQLLRGNGLFGPDLGDAMTLAVWQDSGDTVVVEDARLTVRELVVPWRA